MVFAKETTDGLTSLVKKLDAATAKHTTDKVGSFVVFCSDDKDLETKLKKLAETQKIEHTVLTIDNPAGPQNMDIAKDAAVTVVLYEMKKAKVNHAYKKGELTAAEIDKIVSEFDKLASDKAKK